MCQKTMCRKSILCWVEIETNDEISSYWFTPFIRIMCDNLSSKLLFFLKNWKTHHRQFMSDQGFCFVSLATCVAVWQRGNWSITTKDYLPFLWFGLIFTGFLYISLFLCWCWFHQLQCITDLFWLLLMTNCVVKCWRLNYSNK